MMAQHHRSTLAGAILIPVSVGELIDKITILEIKAACINDDAKLVHVRHELTLLRETRSSLGLIGRPLEDLAGELKAVNETLWKIEDEIRECERRGDFGPRFITLARGIYQQNDRRAALKRRINLLSNSAVVEEKSYARD